MPDILNASRRTQWIALCVFASLLLFIDLGRGSLRNWDEGIYAACSLDMREHDAWLTLHLGDKIWINKTPFYFIATRLAFLAVGVNEWAARLPSALAALGCVLLVYGIAGRLWNRQAGFLAALALLTSAQFLSYGKQGQLDVPMTFFILLTLYCLLRGTERNGWYLAAGVAAAAGYMTKQIMGYLAWPVWILVLVLRGDWKLLFNPWHLAGGMLALLLVIPWHVHEYRAIDAAYRAQGRNDGGEVFLSKLLGYQVVERLGRGVESSNTRWDYYLTDVILKRNRGFCAVLIVAAFAFTAVWRRAGMDRSWWFAVIWTLFIPVFLSLAVSKAKWYLMPWYPAASVWIGGALALGIDERWRRWLPPALAIAAVLTVTTVSGIRDRDFNPAMKAAAPVILDELRDGGSLVVYHPPDSEPALGFYAPVPTAAILAQPGPEAVEALRQYVDSQSTYPTIVIFTRLQAWQELQKWPEITSRLEILRTFSEGPGNEADDVLLLRRK